MKTVYLKLHTAQVTHFATIKIAQIGDEALKWLDSDKEGQQIECWRVRIDDQKGC